MPIGYFKKLFKGKAPRHSSSGEENPGAAIQAVSRLNGSGSTRRIQRQRNSAVFQALRELSDDDSGTTLDRVSSPSVGHALHIQNDRLLFGSSKEMVIRLASNMEDRRRAWALVYQKYRGKGYLSSRPGGLWCQSQDAQPDTTTFLVEHHGKLVASLTLFIDSSNGLPADLVCDASLSKLKARRKVCQAVSFVNEASGVRGSETVKHLFKLVYVTACVLDQCEELIITVRPKHVEFYKKAFLFEAMSREIPHPTFSKIPVVPLRLDLVRADEKLAKRYRSVSPEKNLHRFMLSRAGELRSWVRRNRKPVDRREFQQLLPRSV